MNACAFFKASWYAAEWLQVAAAPTTSSGCMEDGGPLWSNQKHSDVLQENHIFTSMGIIASFVYKTGRIVLQSFFVAASLSRTFQTRRNLNLPNIPPEPSNTSGTLHPAQTIQILSAPSNTSRTLQKPVCAALPLAPAQPKPYMANNEHSPL